MTIQWEHESFYAGLFQLSEDLRLYIEQGDKKRRWSGDKECWSRQVEAFETLSSLLFSMFSWHQEKARYQREGVVEKGAHEMATEHLKTTFDLSVDLQSLRGMPEEILQFCGRAQELWSNAIVKFASTHERQPAMEQNEVVVFPAVQSGGRL